MAHYTQGRRRLALPWCLAIMSLALLFGACGPETSSVAPQSAITPTALTTPDATATATATAMPPGVLSLQGSIPESYTTVACPAGKPSGTICVAAGGSGQLSSLGTISLMRTATLYPGGADSCGPSTMSGSITTASGDTITFDASGTFCRGTASAKYTYRISGGSGAYRGASGAGNITIPRPPTSSTDDLTWSGTLTK